MAAEFNIVDMRRGPLLEHGQQFMLGSPEATLTAIRLRPNDEVQEVEAEIAPAPDDEVDRTPVDESREDGARGEMRVSSDAAVVLNDGAAVDDDVR